MEEKEMTSQESYEKYYNNESEVKSAVDTYLEEYKVTFDEMKISELPDVPSVNDMYKEFAINSVGTLPYVSGVAYTGTYVPMSSVKGFGTLRSYDESLSEFNAGTPLLKKDDYDEPGTRINGTLEEVEEQDHSKDWERYV